MFVNMNSDKIAKMLNELSKMFDEDYVTNLVEATKMACLDRTNCGILSEFTAISAEGNIKFCSFAQNYLKFNNIDNVNLDEYFKIIHNLRAHSMQEPNVKTT